MVAALRCVRPQFQWYQLAYATEIKSIQLHDSIEGLSQKIVSITLHYKLLEHAMKVLERVIEGRVRKIVKIDNMQFGYLAGWSTANLLFSFVSCGRNTC